ncbi:MAG: hypothetical protein U0103_02650 [Candidatus Obscuribacterales bacterium]|nr:hypothetical protein [Cyanobacteria bacterium SZAS LIN-5]
MSTTKEEKDIDYLHPDGKPSTPVGKAHDEESALKEKSVEKSIAEADGHHMCSPDCQKHHQV